MSVLRKYALAAMLDVAPEQVELISKYPLNRGQLNAMLGIAAFGVTLGSFHSPKETDAKERTPTGDATSSAERDRRTAGAR